MFGISASPQDAAARSCAPIAGELISMQGLVEFRDAGVWQTAGPGEALCERDAIRTGRNSRAAIRLTDDAVLRLDENTTLVLADVAPEPEEPSILQLVFGAIQSFSRRPQTLEVDTPYINATIEGTEFALRVNDRESALTVVEGIVMASNEYGSVRVPSGSGAVAGAGMAPQSVIIARPRDAVSWGLYYPPTLSLSDAGAGDSPALAEAMRLAGENRADAAIATLRAASPSARLQLYESALLLSVGRAEDAGRILDSLLAADPANGAALAQRAVIQVVRNERADALATAERAVVAAPDTAAPYIALSLAQQSDFDLEAARDTLVRGTEAVPESALVWARLSEIWLALGYRDRSGEAAARALELDPKLERAHVMQGFAALTEYRTGPAQDAFNRAMALDQADPLPHLGLGLALIREGDLKAGRAELDAAVALDSSRSLLRSYLGKAYFEEDRSPLAVEQFDIAKELDPNDPTPYLYDAIRLQVENRPGEALAAIQESIDRNDNRAVYRSRLQLDQDEAARGASLGRIYEDLGFIQLGMREASRSQDLDPSNAAAHRFLADIYRNERRRELARVSELTRAQLLQDVNLNPIQPSMAETNLTLVSTGGPANAGFNEFTSLFASDGFRTTASGTLGNDETWGGEVGFAMQADGVSVSFGGFEFRTDGFRENFDAEHSIYDLFMQWAVTPKFNLQAEARSRQSELGDLFFNFDPDLSQTGLRFTIKERSARIGARFSPDPQNDTLFSVTYFDRYSNEFNDFNFPGLEINFPEDGDGWQGEVQHIYQLPGVALTVGGSHVEIDDLQSATCLIGGFSCGSFSGPVDTTDTRLYAYGTFEMPVPGGFGDVTLTLGANFTSYEEDNQFFGGVIDVEEFSPKAGLVWDVTDALSFRAAYIDVVKQPFVTNRTIEPTQVAGFNQFFDDYNGTDSRIVGVGIDYQITDRIFFGAESTWRKLDIPTIFGGVVDDTEWKEQTHRAYLNLLAHPRVPVSVGFVYDRFKADPSEFTSEQQVPLEVDTYSVPVSVRYFDPSGFFAGATGTFVHQKVDRDPDNDFFGDAQGDSTFFNLDLAAGYRFPNRRGAVTLQVQNLLDDDFKYQDDGYREISTNGATGPFFPSLTVLGQLTVNF